MEEDSDIEEDVKKESENSQLISPDKRTKDEVMKEAAVSESAQATTSGTIKTFFTRFMWPDYNYWKHVKKSIMTMFHCDYKRDF